MAGIPDGPASARLDAPAVLVHSLVMVLTTARDVHYLFGIERHHHSLVQPSAPASLADWG